MRVSPVVLCRNERGRIPRLALTLEDVRRGARAGTPAELIYVEDGSATGTNALLDQHFDTRR